MDKLVFRLKISFPVSEQVEGIMPIITRTEDDCNDWHIEKNNGIPKVGRTFNVELNTTAKFEEMCITPQKVEGMDDGILISFKEIIYGKPHTDIPHTRILCRPVDLIKKALQDMSTIGGASRKINNTNDTPRSLTHPN